jgi:hypothetical protein
LGLPPADPEAEHVAQAFREPTLLRALPRRHKREVFVAEPHYVG